MFENIPPGPEDPMYYLKKKAEADTSSEKVDIGVGVYRNEEEQYQELGVIKEAKKMLDSLKLGHDYEISSVQALSGSGANHLGALLLVRSFETKPKVFIGLPAWSNTIPLFEFVSLETETLTYIQDSGKVVNFAACEQAVRGAPQGCCHNPTGDDLTVEQWRSLAIEMQKRGHIPFIDIAYQGLGNGLDEDAAGVRILAEMGMEMLVCQSFSKNFALYGERCGALHVVASSPIIAANVQDQLRSFIRREYSSTPAYGSRLVKIVLTDPRHKTQWCSELHEMRTRIRRNRELLYKTLVEVLKCCGYVAISILPI